MGMSAKAGEIGEAGRRRPATAETHDPPQGYKRTEVGVIPEEWGVSSVGQEFKVQLGKMLDAAKNIGVPKPYIGNRAVQWGFIDMKELATIPMSPFDVKRFIHSVLNNCA